MTVLKGLSHRFEGLASYLRVKVTVLRGVRSSYPKGQVAVLKGLIDLTEGVNLTFLKGLSFIHRYT